MFKPFYVGISIKYSLFPQGKDLKGWVESESSIYKFYILKPSELRVFTNSESTACTSLSSEDSFINGEEKNPLQTSRD